MPDSPTSRPTAERQGEPELARTDEVFQPLTAAIISPSHQATGPDPFLLDSGLATVSAIWRVVQAAEFENEDTAVTPMHERHGRDRSTDSSQPSAL
jgi:hypothetical protein